MKMNTEDDEIIRECLDRKPQAFGILVDKYREGIYAFVYAELRDFQDAQDVTQEVFLQAYRKLRSLRNRESFSFWLYRIAYRYCVQWFRDRSRRVDRDFIEDQDPRVMDAPSLDYHRESQVYESVREALAMLPDAYREVLVLHYFGGLTIKDMAKAIGASPAAIGMRLSRARAHMKEEMIAMMNIHFEGHRLPMGFTFRIVEAVKRLKIQLVPRTTGLPWGLSLAVGLAIAVMGISSRLSLLNPVTPAMHSSLSAETRVLKTGEIPVDILKISRLPVAVDKQVDADSRAPVLSELQSASPSPIAGAGTWARKSDMPEGRSWASACTVNGKIYVIGGSTGEEGKRAMSLLEEYDPATGKWTRKADMPTGRDSFSASVVNGKIYVIGGQDAAMRALSSAEEYDPATDTWTKKADMPTARRELATSVVDGKIYATGGKQAGFERFANVEEYDPVTDTWTKKRAMPTGMIHHSSAVVNGKIYAIGGHLMGSESTLVQEYDPATDTWTKKTDMPTGRANLSTAVVDGKIYAIGGSLGIGKNTALSAVEEYDPATDTWTEKADMPTARLAFCAGLVDGRIYTIGGQTL